MAACFLRLNKVLEADKHCDMAIMEDPDYGKATYRKCQILQKRGDYTRAKDLAVGAIKQYSHELEDDESNRKTVPQFQKLVEKLEEQIPF